MRGGPHEWVTPNSYPLLSSGLLCCFPCPWTAFLITTSYPSPQKPRDSNYGVLLSLPTRIEAAVTKVDNSNYHRYVSKKDDFQEVALPPQLRLTPHHCMADIRCAPSMFSSFYSNTFGDSRGKLKHHKTRTHTTIIEGLDVLSDTNDDYLGVNYTRSLRMGRPHN